MKPYQINFSLYALFACMIYLTSCGSQKQAQTAGVHYKTNNKQTITLTSVGFGKSKKDAIDNAERNAFDVLLFKGVPSSPYPKAIVLSPENEVKSKHTKFFAQFYDNRGYKDYVTSSTVLSPASKDKHTKKMKAAVEITINIVSLRRDLEQKGVTHKFGL